MLLILIYFIFLLIMLLILIYFIFLLIMLLILIYFIFLLIMLLTILLRALHETLNLLDYKYAYQFT